MSTEKLGAAINAIKAENNSAARQILAEIVTTEPNNEEAWLYLSMCVEEIDRKKYCLSRVLAINLDNLRARKILDTLEPPPQQLLFMPAPLDKSPTTEGQLSPDNQNYLSQLRDECTNIFDQIAVAEAEDARYTGGLVKSLIAVRLQILWITRAIIEQRMHAIESGAPITIVTPSTTPDEIRAHQLEQEFSRQFAIVEQARAEAALYTGGLVVAMKTSTIATQENTLAMLRQQFLIAKYGLAFPTLGGNVSVDAVTPPSLSVTSTPSTAKPVESPPQLFKILNIDTRVTEANSSWSKHAWKLTIQSLAAVPIQLEAKIEFQDKEGFVIADQWEYNLLLRPGEQNTFTGYKLIDASITRNVASVSTQVQAK